MTATIRLYLATSSDKSWKGCCLSSHLSSHKLRLSYQSPYCKYYFTETALLIVHIYIIRSMNKGTLFAVILLRPDFNKLLAVTSSGWTFWSSFLLFVLFTLNSLRGSCFSDLLAVAARPWVAVSYLTCLFYP